MIHVTDLGLRSTRDIPYPAVILYPNLRWAHPHDIEQYVTLRADDQNVLLVRFSTSEDPERHGRGKRGGVLGPFPCGAMFFVVP